MTITDTWRDREDGYADSSRNSAGMIYKGRFYYNTTKQIYYYDLKTGKTVLVHTDDTPGVDIYEMEIKNGKLTYYLKKKHYTDDVQKVTIKL